MKSSSKQQLTQMILEWLYDDQARKLKPIILSIVLPFTYFFDALVV